MTMQISITNFGGCHSAELNAGAGVTLLGGDGGAAKTSILAAIAATMTGQLTPAGVAKANAGAMVRTGAEKAVCTITGEDWDLRASWPKADLHSSGLPPKVSPIAAGLDHLLDHSPRERATILGPLIGCEPTQKDCIDWLKDSGAELPRQGAATEADSGPMKALGLNPVSTADHALYRTIAKVWPTIAADGWDAAQAKAEKTNREQKGAWRQVTGETYGAAKALAWQPAGLPEGWNGADELDLIKAVDAAKSRRDKAIGDGAIYGAALDTLRAKAAEADEDVAALDAASLAASQTLSQARATLAAIPKPEVAGNQAPCPHCGVTIAIVSRPLNNQKNGHHISLEKRSDYLSLSIKEQREHSNALTAAEVAVTKAEQAERLAIKAAAEAQHRNDLRAQARADLAKADANGAAALIEEATTALTTAEAHLAAHKRKLEADKLARSIAYGQVIIAMLAPDGVRAVVMRRALGGINEFLATLCKAAKWGVVAIEDDLSVTFNGRTSRLADSEAYRRQVALQVALAKLDGSGLVIIDDVFRLPTQARSGLIRLLMRAGIPAILGLMVSSPDKLPNLAKSGVGETYWVEGGHCHPIEDTTQAQAAE